MKTILAAFLCLACAFPALADPKAMLMINGLREDRNVPPLTYSKRLALAAQVHANDMAQRGYFDHTGRDGSSVADRVSGVGYKWCLVAENIAQGQRSLSEVMQAWANSKGHYRNMVNTEAQEFGLAWAKGDYWVMVLARPC